LYKMWSNRILAQAVGIPLKHALALYGLGLCSLEGPGQGFDMAITGRYHRANEVDIV
jgi:hypothetical protein